jgi:hypothetical protein
MFLTEGFVLFLLVLAVSFTSPERGWLVDIWGVLG